MGRWSQYDSDEYRLPEGMVRIGYDADTQQYTFRDTTSGTLYRSAPGANYGILRPVPADDLPVQPHTFVPEDGNRSDHHLRHVPSGKAFHDILPPDEITMTPNHESRSTKFFNFKSMRRSVSSSHYTKPSNPHTELVPGGTAVERDHRSRRDRHQHRRAHTTVAKSGFSLTSTFKSISRSLTTIRHPQREKSVNDDSTH